MMSLTATCNAATYYVDAETGPSGDGSQRNPFSTIQQAADHMQAGDVAEIREGTYRETVIPVHSGTEINPIVFRAYKGEKVIVTGADPVLQWQQDSGHIYYTRISMPHGHENQVFVDGSMMWEARWPNPGGVAPENLLEFATSTMDEGTTATRVVDEHLPDRDWSGATAWVASRKRWFAWTGSVTGHEKGAFSVEDSGSKNHASKQGGQYYLFGARAALDSENEWYYDLLARSIG